MPKRVADVALIVGLAVVYLVTARLGMAFDAVANFATLVWPPTGLAIAALLLLGYRVAPGVFIGAFVANILKDAPVAVAVAIGIGNTAEAVVATYIIRRLSRFSNTLENVRSVVRLMLAAVAGTLISATVGVVSLRAGNIITMAQVPEAWSSWMIGDMVGALIITPLILVWSNPPHTRFHQRPLEVVALGVSLFAASILAFFSKLPTLASFATPFHQTDLLLVVLIWAALRFGQRGAATATFGISAMAVAGITLGYAPFAEPALRHSLFSLQTFMTVVAVTFLLLGATIAERRCAYGAAREAYREAARANRVKSDFLAVMSHELRTPLNAIAGYAQLLETGVYGPLNEKQTDGVVRIRVNEQQLLEQINEVLGFVSAEKGDVAVHAEPVQVTEALDALEPLVESELRAKRFVVRRDMIRPRLAVQADRKSLEQILLSLLSNASKYTKDGGTITLGAEREGDTVRIWIRDTGAGIPQQEIDHVFEPFFQSERGPTRQVAGVGLGLTIARDLAHRMSGEVTIASEVGSGTTASVVLPAA